MRYKPKNTAALQVALGGLPQERDPESAVRMSKVSVATRVSPKQ